MADRDFQAQLAGFSLTTAEILYRLPDHPSLLQSFIWQEYDVHPRFPAPQELPRFLDGEPGRQALSRDGGAQPSHLAGRAAPDRRRVPRALNAHLRAAFSCGRPARKLG